MLANYFFIAILEGEPRRFEPRPDLEASKQTQLKLSYFFSILYIILNCEVVIMLETCADEPGLNPCVVIHSFSLALTIFPVLIQFV
jgi:hypothetical protein